jgi:uncharacterized protein
MAQNNKVTFALVVRHAPWWEVGEITRKIMSAQGYDIELSQSRSEDHQIERVVRGEADLAIVVDCYADWAFSGRGPYSGKPRSDMRAITFIGQPQWLGFAVRRETHLRSLDEVRERRFPLRLYTYRGAEITGSMAFMLEEVLRAHDITLEKIESWGGQIWTDLNGGKEAVRDGNFDAFFKHVYPSNGPVGRVWQEATNLFNMRFLPIRDEVVASIIKKHPVIRKGSIPRFLMKGVDTDVPSFYLKGHTVFASASMDDKFAYELAAAYWRHADEFMLRYVTFAYNPHDACGDAAIPLHPGAERFYREHGFQRERQS